MFTFLFEFWPIFFCQSKNCQLSPCNIAFGVRVFDFCACNMFFFGLLKLPENYNITFLILRLVIYQTFRLEIFLQRLSRQFSQKFHQNHLLYAQSIIFTPPSTDDIAARIHFLFPPFGLNK